jgi:UDPglucose--hexose-1-phosphate uridylyltransferase
MPQFRKDPFTDRWAIIATERAKRPEDLKGVARQDPADPCPFCSGNEAMTPPEVLAYRDSNSAANQPGWTLRVFPNKYPALVPDGNQHRRAQGLYESANALGVHELLVETEEHATNVAKLSQQQFNDIVRAYRDRMVSLRADKRWRYVLIYKNQGAEAGATLEHLHSQIVGLPVVPRKVTDELKGAKEFHERSGRCLYCEVIKAEIADSSRIVCEEHNFIALCPYAPRFPFETWILPKRHSPYFDHASERECAEFALILRESLIRIDRRLSCPPFNYVLHSGPFDSAGDYYHWHLEIMPRLAGVAGFEWGSGFFINTAAPEDTARELRAALG